ncbi:exported protein of unknown function [Hyphomicrobium sp. 1Nfss2.1]
MNCKLILAKARVFALFVASTLNASATTPVQASVQLTFQIAADDYYLSPSWSSNGAKLALLGWNGTVALIDVVNQRLSHRFKIRPPVAQVLISPDASKLAAYDSRNLRIYSTQTGQEIARVAAPRDCIFYANRSGGAVWTDDANIAVACAIAKVPLPNDELVRALNVITYSLPGLAITRETHVDPNPDSVSSPDIYIRNSNSGVIVLRSFELKRQTASSPRQFGIECTVLSSRVQCFPSVKLRRGVYYPLRLVAVNREVTKVAVAVSEQFEGSAEAVIHVYYPLSRSQMTMLPPSTLLSSDPLASSAMSTHGDLIAASYLGSESSGTSGWLLWNSSGALLHAAYGQRVQEISFSPDDTGLVAVGKDAIRFYQID